MHSESTAMALPTHWNAVFQKAGRTREKPDGKQNPAERR